MENNTCCLGSAVGPVGPLYRGLVARAHGQLRETSCYCWSWGEAPGQHGEQGGRLRPGHPQPWELLLAAAHIAWPQLQPYCLTALPSPGPHPVGPDPGHPRAVSDLCSFHQACFWPPLMHELTSWPVTEWEKRLLRVAEGLRLHKAAVQGLTAEVLSKLGDLDASDVYS